MRKDWPGHGSPERPKTKGKGLNWRGGEKIFAGTERRWEAGGDEGETDSLMNNRGLQGQAKRRAVQGNCFNAGSV